VSWHFKGTSLQNEIDLGSLENIIKGKKPKQPDYFMVALFVAIRVQVNLEVNKE